jgi:hypothetical protein
MHLPQQQAISTALHGCADASGSRPHPGHNLQFAQHAFQAMQLTDRPVLSELQGALSFGPPACVPALTFQQTRQDDAVKMQQQ